MEADTDLSDVDSPIQPHHVVGMLWYSASVGNVAAAEWLVDFFHLTDVDARAYDNRALRTACRHRRVDFAQWLVQRFGLSTPDDGRVRDNEILRRACADGNLAMVEWLVATYQLGPDDARACGNAALSVACAAGATGVVDLLLWSFMLGAPDLLEADAVGHARSCGHRDLANQLCRTFDLGGEDDDDPTPDNCSAPAEDAAPDDAPGAPADAASCNPFNPFARQLKRARPDRSPEIAAMIAQQAKAWDEAEQAAARAEARRAERAEELADEAADAADAADAANAADAAGWNDCMSPRAAERSRVTEVLSQLVPSMNRVRINSRPEAVVAMMTEAVPTLVEAGLAPASYLEMLTRMPGNVRRHSSEVLQVLYDSSLVSAEDVLAWFVDADPDCAVVRYAERFIQLITADAPQNKPPDVPQTDVPQTDVPQTDAPARPNLIYCMHPDCVTDSVEVFATAADLQRHVDWEHM